ncbi:HAD family phosphatase [candidate division KSB1 bacterium]|nr:HAD family phosphatase [candidate division KSB1 bacterium]
MTKFIIFDLGQVLVKVLFPEFLQKFAAEFRIDPSEITDNRHNGAHIDFMVGKIPPEEFYQKTCKHFNHDISIKKFKALWLQMLGEEIGGTGLIINELEKKNNNLALLSNIDPWHYEYCERTFPVLNKFSKKFLSYQMKMKKPGLEIYQQVAKELFAKPEECLFIDDLLENVEAAQQVGYEAIQFIDPGQLHGELVNRGILEGS